VSFDVNAVVNPCHIIAGRSLCRRSERPCICPVGRYLSVIDFLSMYMCVSMNSGVAIIISRTTWTSPLCLE